MRLVIVLAAVAALSVPALAQQPQQPRPSAPPRPPAAAQPQPPAPPPSNMFPCRAQGEVCHVGVATSANQVVILYSNAPQGQAAEGKTVTVQGADLAQHVGKVVMLTGDLGASGIAGAQVVEAAGPLLSFAIKMQMGGDDGGQPGPARGAPPPRGGPPQGQRR